MLGKSFHSNELDSFWMEYGSTLELLYQDWKHKVKSACVCIPRFRFNAKHGNSPLRLKNSF